MRFLLYLALLPTLQALDIEEKGVENREGVKIHDVTFANLTGGRTAAYLVASAKPGKSAAILFVHWLEPHAKDSNRTQFLGQAVELAKLGTTSLLIETMWSDPEWFNRRDPSQDYAKSVQQVKELGRALDVLLAQPQIDKNRVAYVGHDFGMMYGAVLAGTDRRVHVWALQAGTTSFSDWFLLFPRREGEERRKVIEELAPLDPVKHIGKAAGSPVLLQFGKTDPYVPLPKAQEFYDATKEPKKILWYEAGHGLNGEAIHDRQEWLKEQLHLNGNRR
jgi:dienelactone hydrolase